MLRWRGGGGQATINPNSSVSTEVGSTLGSWPDVYTLGATTTASTDGVTVTRDTPVADTDTLSVPQLPDLKKFARLKVTQTP